MDLDRKLRDLAAKLGLWFSPIGRLRRLVLAGIMLVIPLAIASGFIARHLVIGMLSSTYTGQAVLEIRDLPEPPNLTADVTPYQMPQASDPAVVSWMYEPELYRSAYPNTGRDDGVTVFRSLVDIGHDRDPRRIYVTYRGAYSPEDAVAGAMAVAQTAVQRARQRAGDIIDRDTRYYRQRLDEAEARLTAARTAVISASRETGIVAPDEEAITRANRARNTAAQASELEAELRYLDQRLLAIPELITTIPAEVTGSRAAGSAAGLKVDALRDRVRRLTAIYADGNPLLANARDELAAAEAELALADANPTSDDRTMIRNPVLDVLAAEAAALTLDRPALVARAERIALEAETARAELADLPPLLAAHRTAVGEQSRNADLVGRLRARVGELALARGLNHGQLRIVQPANLAAVTERSAGSKALLVAIAIGVLTCLGGGVIVAWLVLRDRRIRSKADARFAVNCADVVDLPGRDPAAVDDPEHRGMMRDLADRIGRKAASCLVIAQSDPGHAGRVGQMLAARFADAGLNTFLVADGTTAGLPDPGVGLADILAGDCHPTDALVSAGPHLGWLPLGDRERLADQVPSAHIELCLAEMMERAEVVVIAAPDDDQALIRRLAMAVESLVAVVDPRAKSGSQYARSLRALNRPAVAALRVPKR